MPFPAAIAEAQRASLLADIIQAMDIAEECYRSMGEAAPHLVALTPATFGLVQDKCQDAYTALFNARAMIEEEVKNG